MSSFFGLKSAHHPTPIYDFLARTLPYLFPSAIRDPLLNGTSSLLSWQPGHTPFSTGPSVLIAGLSYLAIIFGGRELMRKFNVGPWRLHQPFVVHNALLSSGSALLLACMLEEIVPVWRRHGFFYAICAESAWTSRMETLYIFVSLCRARDNCISLALTLHALFRTICSNFGS